MSKPGRHANVHPAPHEALSRFSEPTREWFAAAFAVPTAAQVGAWEAIGAGKHALVVAAKGGAWP